MLHRKNPTVARVLALSALAGLVACGELGDSPLGPLGPGNPALSVSSACIAPPSGMVSWWQADGDATDAVGTLDGTLFGAAGFAPGIVGEAFSLNGWGDYVEIGPAGGDFGTADFTVDMWVSFNTLAGEQTLIERWDQFSSGAASGWTLVKLSPFDSRGGDAIFLATSSASRFGGQGLLRAMPQIDLGTWYHVAVTRAGDVFSLYWNGQLVDSYAQAIDLTADASLLIGRRGPPDPRGNYLNGLEDEIEIHDRALAASEIAAIHGAGSAGKCRGPQSIAIDVKPESSTNTVSCKAAGGVVPVAILTTEAFDATDVDATTVRFGRTGSEAAEAHGRGHPEDVDGDGDLDLMMHFRFGDTGLACGDSEAVLTGGTFGGRQLVGTDAIRTVG